MNLNEFIRYSSSVQKARRALKGKLKIVNHPASKTHSFADDKGPRRILFCSNFCALRDCYNDNPIWEQDLDTAANAGYQGIRIFRLLGESDTSGYFAGRTVQKSWAPDTLVKYARACQDRGLRLQLSMGHQWEHQETDRLPWERVWAEAIRDEGLSEVISLVEGDNEYWQNATWKDSPEQHALYCDLFAMLRTILPNTFYACGAPQDESPDNIFKAATCSDLCEIHTSRDVDKMVRRPFTIWYWEGQPGFFPKPYWHGEPTPFAGGPDDFMPTPSPGRQIAQFAISQLVGGAVSYFDGWDVRSTEPLEADAPTFYSAPKFLANLPEDCATATHIPGGKIWWWNLSDGRFATVWDEQWGTEALELPDGLYPRSWRAHGPFNTTLEGSGPIRLPAGCGGALIEGERA